MRVIILPCVRYRTRILAFLKIERKTISAVQYTRVHYTFPIRNDIIINVILSHRSTCRYTHYLRNGYGRKSRQLIFLSSSTLISHTHIVFYYTNPLLYACYAATTVTQKISNRGVSACECVLACACVCLYI